MIRAVDGPLANVRGVALGAGRVRRAARSALRDVWVAVRASLRGVLEYVTLADLARGELPDVGRGARRADPDAWAPH